jgi:hypothetical protein
MWKAIIFISLFSLESCSSIKPKVTNAPMNQEDVVFFVRAGDQILHLQQWDREMDITRIFGKPVKEEVRVLGEGADTHMGSKMKTQQYPGITLVWFSPKQSINYWLQEVIVTSSKYTTTGSLKTGDKLSQLKATLPAIICNNSKSRLECNYRGDGDEKNLYFLMRDDTIKTFRLFYMIP